MFGIDSSQPDKCDIKCRESYRISPEEERREKNKHHEDEKESLAGGGNIDSGYHSFNGSSNCCTCCSSKKREMEQTPTTVCFMQDKIKLFETQNGYLMNPVGREGQSPILPAHKSELVYDVKDRGYNSLPDVSSMRVMSNDSVIPSSDGYSPYIGQQTSSIYRTTGDVATTTTASPSRSSNGGKIETLAHELAEKIEFCLKLGYNVEQVRKTLQLLGHKASKNDILTKLFTLPKSNAIEMSETMTLCHSVTAFNEGKPGEFIGRGVSNMELLSRGPSTVEDDTKESEDGSVASDNLRPIVIDGSNVAMSHGNREYFSCKGILLAVQYFLDRGHRDITVFVPIYRKEQTRPDAPIKDQEILTKLEQDKILVWTPSRKVGGRRITCYDDRFILKLAQDTDGVIVSNDNFRDLQTEKPEWKEVVEKRLLMYSFVNDRFMPPDDPLGRNGPSLDNFLRKRLSSEEKRKPECPYGKRCTFGKKCKYFHAECSASQRSVSEQLKDGTKKRMQPSSAAKSLATEVMNEFPMQNGRNHTSIGAQTQKTQNGEISETLHEENFARRNAQQVRNSSPSEMGACGSTLGVTHPSPTHQQQQMHATMLPMSLSSEFQRMNMSQYHLAQGHGGQYYTYRHVLNDGSLATIPHTEGQSSNPSSVSMSQMQTQMGNIAPQLHSAVGRNVVSSTSPHQHHLQQRMHLQHHSSPPAISVYDQGSFMGQRQPPNQPNQMFQNMTYPSLGQQFQNYPMHHSYYKSNGSNQPQQMMYPYPRMMQQQQHPSMYMGPAMGQDGSMLPTTTQSMPQIANPAYQSYLYQQQEFTSRMMAPGSLTTAPHPNMDPIFESPNRQVFSSPNPGNANQMLHRQSLPNHHGSPVKLPLNHHPQVSQPMFKDPSDPRFHLYRNLCGLFSRSTVEKIMLLHPHESDPKRLAKYCLEIDS